MHFIGKTKHFAKWAKKAGLSDQALRTAVSEMEEGLVDADLGGGVVKKRVALPGQGKRGGSRTLIAANKRSKWIFVFGFEKNERDNLTGKELEALQVLAQDLLALTEPQIQSYTESGKLIEVSYEQKADRKPNS